MAILREFYPHLLAMAALLCCSAFFSGSETALFNLSRDQLRRFRAARSPFRNLAARLMDDPRRLLVTVLFGNMAVNVAFFALSVTLTVEIAGRYPAWSGPWRFASTFVTPLLVIIFGEVTPKSLAATMPERLAPIAGLPLTILEYAVLPIRLALYHTIVAPLERVITGRRPERKALVTTEELQSIVELSEREGAVSRDESDMLVEVLELADLKVREVMTPRVEVVACPVARPTGEALDLFRRTRHSKLVVYGEDIDDVRGVVYAKTALLNPEAPLGELAAPIHWVPESKSVESLLREFRARRIQFALVADEYGGLAGLVTLEDCLEQIVGDIEDEPAARPVEEVQRVSPSEYYLAGDLSIRAWADLFDQDRPGGGRFSTLGGFVTSLVGRMPRRGDTARWRNLEFTVDDVRNRRVTRVRVRLLDVLDSGKNGKNGSAGAPPPSEAQR